MITETKDLFELIETLKIAVDSRIMSIQQAAFVWKKVLRDTNLLPPKDFEENKFNPNKISYE